MRGVRDALFVPKAIEKELGLTLVLAEPSNRYIDLSSLGHARYPTDPATTFTQPSALGVGAKLAKQDRGNA